MSMYVPQDYNQYDSINEWFIRSIDMSPASPTCICYCGCLPRGLPPPDLPVRDASVHLVEGLRRNVPRYPRRTGN